MDEGEAHRHLDRGVTGRKRIIRLMQRQGLKARVRKRFKCTMNGDHDQPVAANLLDREFEADRPNQKWVGDTTELETGNGKLFLAVGRFWLAGRAYRAVVAPASLHPVASLGAARPRARVPMSERGPRLFAPGPAWAQRAARRVGVIVIKLLGLLD